MAPRGIAFVLNIFAFVGFAVAFVAFFPATAVVAAIFVEFFEVFLVVTPDFFSKTALVVDFVVDSAINRTVVVA